MKSTFLEELRWRGFLEAATSDDIDAFLCEAPRTIYVGFDPTADSLHLGNLIPVMGLAHAQRHGHRPLVLVGGGTGLIGDPGGKSTERILLTKEKAAQYALDIRAQLSRFFELSPNDMLNNADWLCSLNLLEFLRDIGKHFSVNEMIKRDSVRTRLEERDQGISYTEFSYMLMQAYDFLHLFRERDCTIQMGGSDQWGNIVSGKDLIRRVTGGRAEGITFPLLMTSTGRKFGKSGEALWLNAQRTSPYRIYQYWLQTADADAIRFLKLFTFLDQARIQELEQEVATKPENREAQRVLAAESTAIIHGEEAASAAAAASRILFGSDETPTLGTVIMLKGELPYTQVEPGIPLVDLLVRTGLAESKGAARKLVEGGGVYLHNERQTDPRKTVSADDSKWAGRVILLRAGKKNYHLVTAG
jgi:tyrosyl-tRNA synthetase